MAQDPVQPKIKLLMVINSLTLAGAEVLVAELVPLLRARGIDVSVAILKPLNSPLEVRLQRAGIEFLSGGPGKIYSPLHVLNLKKHLHRFDLVHVHLFPAQLWCVMARGSAGRTPVLLNTEHNTDNHRRRPWLRWLDAWMYSRYEHIACNSDATRARLREWLPGLQMEVSVVPNGISLERFRNARPLSKLSLIGVENARLLISVARMQPQKDHVTLLQAFAQLPPQTQLALVGDGELKTTLEALARRLEVAPRVHFLGRRADIPALLKTADIFVHATHSDGFCLAAVEAMAAGLPVVASQVAGLSDVIGDAGALVPPGDSNALANSIAELLASPQKRSALSVLGQQRAGQFSIEATADAYVHLYRNLLTRAQKGAV